MLYQRTDARSNGVTPSARLRNSWTSLSALFIYLFIYLFIHLFIYLFIIIIIIFDSGVFYNLGNENELLASMDIDHPVRIEGKKRYK